MLHSLAFHRISRVISSVQLEKKEAVAKSGESYYRSEDELPLLWDDHMISRGARSREAEVAGPSPAVIPKMPVPSAPP